MQGNWRVYKFGCPLDARLRCPCLHWRSGNDAPVWWLATGLHTSSPLVTISWNCVPMATPTGACSYGLAKQLMPRDPDRRSRIVSVWGALQSPTHYPTRIRSYMLSTTRISDTIALMVCVASQGWGGRATLRPATSNHGIPRAMDNELRVADDVRRSTLRAWSRTVYCSSSMFGMYRSGHRGPYCVWETLAYPQTTRL